MPLRIPSPKNLSDLLINVDKDWAGKNITNLGDGAFDLNAKLSGIPTIPAATWATIFNTTFPIATVLNNHTKAVHDALGIARIDLLNIPTVNNTGWGLETTDTVGEDVDPGEICYMKSDGKYWLADADAAASMPAKVMAMEAILADAAGRILHIGYFRHDAWGWVLGDGEANLLFAHTTPGEMVQLANKPTGSGDQVQVVAYVKTADVVFFNPSYELVEIS